MLQVNISFIPIEEMSKTVREIEHHWLGQADAELQICLLFLQKDTDGKFSAGKLNKSSTKCWVTFYWLLCVSFKYIDQH